MQLSGLSGLAKTLWEFTTKWNATPSEEKKPEQPDKSGHKEAEKSSPVLKEKQAKRDPQVVMAEAVQSIRTPGNWTHELGDHVAHLAANTLGRRVCVIDLETE